jgi:hypothetical protein
MVQDLIPGIEEFEGHYLDKGKAGYPTTVLLKEAQAAYNHINAILCKNQSWYDLVKWFGIEAGEILPSADNVDIALESSRVKVMFQGSFPLDCMHMPSDPSNPSLQTPSQPILSMCHSDTDLLNQN